jgi:AbrB family looped-hinge helix DNA binding protein
MVAVTVSSKFQVVIPLEVRTMLHIKSGQKMQMIAYNNRIVLVPDRPIWEGRGSLKGMDTAIEREEDQT